MSDITSVNEAIFLYSGFDRWCYTVRHNAKRIGAAVTNDVSSNPADGEKKQVKNKTNSNTVGLNFHTCVNFFELAFIKTVTL